jgi:LuxR family maltose regulon positive regulatory protein
MAHDVPVVADGLLTQADGTDTPPIPVGSAVWWQWLAAPGTTRFHFASGPQHFTARREQKAGRAYWYAYRRHGSTLRKVYLGKAADLTPDRLLAAAATLARPTADTEESPAPEPQRAPLGPARAPVPAPLPLLATKLYIPQPHGSLVPRPRLLARLDGGLAGRLTLISAPAGSGKTTLLGDWLQHSPRMVAWLSLDAGDRDPGVFLRYLVAALQTLAPGAAATTALLLQTPQPPPLPVLLAGLANELVALPAGSILVLDDYHVLEGTAIRDVMTFLLEHLPPALHLVVASREDPALPLARLRARRALTELRAADLRFTAEEAAAFLTEVMGLPLAPADIAALEARTEGWIAGLQLAALAMQDRADTGGFIQAFTGSNRFIVDYLAEEVFARQPDHLQTFLLQTAILERMCGPLCDAVLLGNDEAGPPPGATFDQHSYSQPLLEELERANLFLVPLDNDRRWYRYHHLFAEVLRGRLLTGDGGAIAATLHRRAATWYETNGYLADAMEHALAGADYDRAGRLIHAKVQGVLPPGDMPVLLRWFAALPEDLIHGQPQLSVDYAWALAAVGRLDTAAQYAQTAQRMLQPDGADAAAAEPATRALLGDIATVFAYVAGSRGDVARTIALLQQARTLWPETTAGKHIASTLFLAQAYTIAEDFPAAYDAFAEAEAASRAAGNPFLALTALINLATIEIQQGRLRQAAGTCRRALQLDDLRDQPLMGLAHTGMGIVACEWNDLAGAREHLERGIALLELGGDSRVMLAYSELAHVHQARGDLSAVQAVFARAEETGRRLAYPGAMPLLEQLLERLAVRAALAGGNLDAAERWVTQYLAGPGNPVPYRRDGDLLMIARIRLAAGRPDAALDVLTGLHETANTVGRTRTIIQLRVLQAIAWAAQGQPAHALAALAEALTLAEPEGYMRVFLDEGAPLVPVLRQARARGITPAYTRKLLAAFEAAGPTPGGPQAPAPSTVGPAPALVEPLSERERAVLRLLVAGLSAPEIAGTLVVGTSTVKTHLKNIYGKLDVHSRAEAVDRARALQLI